MKKLFLATAFMSAMSITASAKDLVKNLDVCVKAYSSSETQAALRSCQSMILSFSQIDQNGVKFQNSSCLVNAQGAGAGYASMDCGLYDVVLKTTLTVSE